MPVHGLLKNFIAYIQSYLFNRLGFVLFPPAVFECYAQFLSKDLYILSIESTGLFSILPSPSHSADVFESCEFLTSTLDSRFGSFNQSDFNVSPAYHVHGGSTLLDNPLISQLCSDNLLLYRARPQDFPWAHSIIHCNYAFAETFDSAKPLVSWLACLFRNQP